MLITDIWLDSRLKDIFIESKNTQIEVRMRNSKLEYTRSHTIVPIHTIARPKGCRSILATPVNANFKPKFALEAAL